MKITLSTDEIMSAVRRDLERQGYQVGDIDMEWRANAYSTGFVKISAEIKRNNNKEIRTN